MASPDLVIQLSALGFETDADALAQATTPAEERRAIDAALHAIEGYQLCLHRHSRVYADGQTEANQLADAEEQLFERLSELTHHLEEDRDVA